LPGSRHFVPPPSCAKDARLSRLFIYMNAVRALEFLWPSIA
jgi:hypothetical protein